MTNITFIIIIILTILVAIIYLYNGLVRKRFNVKESFSGIQIQMKRRYDLIPNLINTVKGYANHESKVFKEVTEARTQAMQGGSIEQQSKSENMLSGALKSLFAVSENYPDLKANQNFLKLQEELTDTEDKLQAARRFYNNSVKSLNTSIDSVPTNIIASLFKFKKEVFFELDSTEKEAAQKPVEAKF